MRIRVSLLPKKSKKKNTGKCPVFARCVLDGQRIELSTSVYVDVENWDKTRQEIAENSTGHRKRLTVMRSFRTLILGVEIILKRSWLQMGAAYICGICGIENGTIDNRAAYIQGWLKKLKSDKKFIVSVAGLAQKAVDYILENQNRPSLAKPVQVKRKRRKKVKSMALAI